MSGAAWIATAVGVVIIGSVVVIVLAALVLASQADDEMEETSRRDTHMAAWTMEQPSNRSTD